MRKVFQYPENHYHKPMLKNVSNTLVIMIGTMLASFVVTVIAGRNLSMSEFGEFALLKQVILIGSTIAIFGLDYSYIKLFPKRPNADRKTHAFTMGILVFMSLIIVSILQLTYQFETYKISFIFISICFGAINLYQAAISRLQGKFFIAQLLAGGWKIALLILIGLCMYSNMSINIQLLYPLFSVSLCIFSVFMIRNFFSKQNDAVHDEFSTKTYVTFGLILWLINASGLISGGIDKLMIPIIFDREILGVYTGSSFLFVITLSMIGSAIGYVIFPNISAGKDINYKKLSASLFFIILLIIFVFQIVGKELVSILFSGRFDSQLTQKLILYFSVIGSLQIIHIILHFMLSAKLGNNQLLVYFILSLFFIALFVLLLPTAGSISSVVLLDIATIVIFIRSLKVIAMGVLYWKKTSDMSDEIRILPETL